MTNARLLLTASALMIAGLGYAEPRRNNPLMVIGTQKQVPQPPATRTPATSPISQDSSRPAVAAPANAQGPVVLNAVVVDSKGHGLAGVDVSITIASARPAEGQESVADRAVSDHDGKIRVEIARERVEGRRTSAIIWAYQPGRAIARAATASFPGTASPPVIRLTLEDPVKRTITVVGADDRPIEGLRAGTSSRSGAATATSR